MTPKLPLRHIFPDTDSKSGKFKTEYLKIIKKWIIHPIKRRISKYYLSFLRIIFGLKVIGITGSTGKTSTKEMLASILKRKLNVVYSFANVDPVYNIPSTILQCTPFTKYLILEMGVEFPGEMDYYLWLAKPDIGIITNIYPTHTEYFGNADGVFREKRKLVDVLGRTGMAVLNKDDRYLAKLGDLYISKIKWFGKNSDVSSVGESIDPDLKTVFRLKFRGNINKTIDVHLKVLGHANVLNALAASACAVNLGLLPDDIKRGLEEFLPLNHRFQVIKHKSGAIIIDDSYNSNPEAAKQSINSFAVMSEGKYKVVVFGDMKELGRSEVNFHNEMGKYLSEIKPDHLICVGKASENTARTATTLLGEDRVKHFFSTEDVLKEIKPYLKKNSYILFKGSRSIGLDKVVSGL